MSRSEDALADIPYESLGELGEHLLVVQDRGLSHRTVFERLRILQEIEKHAGCSLIEASEDAVRKWWRSLSRRRPKVGPSSRATYLTHPREFYRWALREGLRDDDPTRRIDPPKRPSRLPRDLDPRAALSTARGPGLQPRERLACALALEAGLRRKEIVEIRTPGDVIERPDGPVLRVQGKGDRERVVPISTALAAEIRRAPKGWLFPSTRGESKHLTPDGLGHLMREALDAVGNEATLHQYRHTSAMALLARTRDIEAVRVLLGQKTLAAVQIYARHLGVDRRDVLSMWDVVSPAASSSEPEDGLIEVRRRTTESDQVKDA